MDQSIDERLKKRIYAFYLAGAFNLVLGVWVLFYGEGLEGSTRNIMLAFFFGFAALDFWFPSLMKKKVAEYQRQAAQLQNPPAQGDGGVKS